MMNRGQRGLAKLPASGKHRHLNNKSYRQVNESQINMGFNHGHPGFRDGFSGHAEPTAHCDCNGEAKSDAEISSECDSLATTDVK